MAIAKRKDPLKAARGKFWRGLMADMVDAAWYRVRHRDAMATGLDPLKHFLRFGIEERRDPNAWFDSAWYAAENPDFIPTGLDPLTHYIYFGAQELRKPHPRFDAVYYAREHPEAAENPLLYHMRFGRKRGYRTEYVPDNSACLPSENTAFVRPDHVVADIVIAVAGTPQQTRDCVMSVLANSVGRVIVTGTGSADPALARWLRMLAGQKRIVLTASGSVAEVIEAERDHDVVVLGAGTEVAAGWLDRLVAQAYAAPRIATVSPFSNAASPCGYPDPSGGPPVFGLSTDAIDRACRMANAGRFASVPFSTDGCVYIRRDALRDVGLPDTMRPNWLLDFCQRGAAKGWRHHVACDTFVRCATGRPAPAVGEDPAAPFRFAVTAALFAASGLPVILMVTHAMGGGIGRHIDSIIKRTSGRAHVLILEGNPDSSVISVPALPHHPRVALTADQTDDLERMLRSANISRVHIHHLLNIRVDLAGVIRRLGVPFDLTVHDYFAICPQINLLPRPANPYCGLPGPATCNACIGISPSAFRARDILSWRVEREWVFKDAARIICPSDDVRNRLAGLGLAERAVVVPHDPVTEPNWPLMVPKLSGEPLRVVLLGILAMHKGAMTVAEVAATAVPGTLDIHCIGYLEDTFPNSARPLIHATGPYKDEDLPALLRELRPHVVWLPSMAPETYSYTLTTAIEAGLPIVATDFGSFRERTAGRPFTWLVDHRAPASVWIETFEHVRKALRKRAAKHQPVPRSQVRDFYTDAYLPARRASPPRKPRRDKPTIAVVAERFESGHLSPCAFIRLLQPLDHPDIGGMFRTHLDSPESVLARRADIIVTQRHAVPDMVRAEALVEHARRSGAKLIFDLDDDLLTVPPDHADAAVLRPRARVVRLLVDAADAVWVSSRGLAKRLARIRPDVTLIENALDERIWAYGPAPPRFQPDPLRILCMGTGTHHDDLAMIMPGLVRLKAEYGERVVIDIVGMSDEMELPKGIRRLGPPLYATQSYPAFVHWINTVPERWHIGLAPLLDTPFNRCKSPIKTMDYAAMGMVVLASDMPVYRGSLADGPVGHLVENDPHAWYEALEWLLRDQALRQTIARRTRSAFLEQASLGSQAAARRGAWKLVLS